MQCSKIDKTSTPKQTWLNTSIVVNAMLDAVKLIKYSKSIELNYKCITYYVDRPG